MQRSVAGPAVTAPEPEPFERNGEARDDAATGERDETRRVSSNLGGIRALVAEVLSYEATWVLDVFCGDGDFARDVLEEARTRGRRLEVVALDESDATLAVARTRAGDDPLLRFVRAEARSLPFPDNAFDLSTCTLSLHRFEPGEVVEVLREMRRVTRLTPIVCDLERSRLGVFAASAFARFDRTRRPNGNDAALVVKRSYTLGELEEFARLAGWRAPSARRSGIFHVVMSDGE